MQLHWKKSVLVRKKILRLFVNTLTVDEKHYLLNRDNLTQPIQMQLYQKQKTFSEFFFCIFKICIKFSLFAKKRRPSQPLCFWKYCLRKIWLDKCPKIPVSEDHQKHNTTNGSKIFSNLKDSTFTIIINHCGGRCIGRSLSQ